MTKEIVVSVGRRETRVAMVEDGKLAELKIERERDVLGNIYIGTVQNVVSGLDAAFVDCGLDRNVFLHVSDAVLAEPTRRMLRRKMESFPPIAEVVQPGEKLLMQVTKGSVGSKGPRATRRISLPGRYLVLMVQGGDKVGVSRKIEDEAERNRLRDLGEKVKPEGMGIIIRTRAEGVGRSELQHDITFLTRLWDSIRRRGGRTPSPALIHEDLSLVFEIIRDVFSADIDRFVVDDDDVYRKVLDLVGSIALELKSRVKRYEGKKPAFVEYDLEKQIERALRPRVWLPQGGHINIDQTEALTSIDVNSGKFTGARSLADTVLRTNLQAVEEIVRQMRVRDIGGIIVVDFIDMDNPHHRREVMARLKEELKRDRIRTRVAHLTPLGLVEMTRKRTGDSLNVQLLATCPCCEGRGRIASVETTAIRIEDRLRELAAKDRATDYRVTCSPTVGLNLIGEEGAEIAGLEEELGRRVHVRCNPAMHPERFAINTGAPPGVNEEGLPFSPGDSLTIEPGQVLDIPSEGLLAVVEGCLVHVPDGPQGIDQAVSVRLAEVTHSYVRGTHGGGKAPRRGRPAPRRAAEGAAPGWIGELEAAGEAEAEPAAEVAAETEAEPAAEVAAETEAEPAAEVAAETAAPAPARKRRRRPRGGRRKTTETVPATPEGSEPAEAEQVVEGPPEAPEEPAQTAPVEAEPPKKRPRRRSRGSRRKPAAEPSAEETVASPEPPEPASQPEPSEAPPVAEPTPTDSTGEPTEEAPPKRPRPRWRARAPRRKPSAAAEPAPEEPEPTG